ncbi:hypothetical protein H072_122 [Dactylellina haptotyla CBS 200.50]|uniref:Nucleoside phosphorylase domain-containing protein n=1 Tax=Dactylellina haptotyla (strain CBS 200.50) TaxID=1284197 RepID=S8ASE0_DACHA|nr:hypothetical protein H072_122 [Dactylellina haptotyla CBS 200.50]
MAPETLTHAVYTVGWVCSLSKEQTAATAMLDHIHPDLLIPTTDSNIYTLGSIGAHNVVIACLPKGITGSVSAATVAVQMLSTFPNIKFGLLVGIGSGVPKSKVRLGDVVVSTPTKDFPAVVQWDMGTTEAEGFKRTGTLRNPPKLLLTAISKIETEYERIGPRIPEYLDELGKKFPKLKAKYQRSEWLEDILFKSTYTHIAQPSTNSADEGDEDEDMNEDEDEDQEDICKYCDRSKLVKRKSRDMQVHYGLIASGNQDIKDASLRDKLNKSLGEKILCVDMEAAGLLDDFPCIVVKGICDYADSHSNETWQEHAAAVAAAFAKDLLRFIMPVAVESERPAKELLKLGEAISRIEANVERTVSHFTKDEDLKILNWLAPVDYESQQTDYIRRRQPGTGQWLLQSSEFKTWIEATTTNKVLFCPGIPGAGKTIITSIVIDHLQEIFRNSDVGIAYIYFNFKKKDGQNVRDLFASLLRQFIKNKPMPQVIRELHRHHSQKNSSASFEEIYKTLLAVTARYSRIFLLVDAIDECQVSDGTRIQFLSELSMFRAKIGANYFATSRFIPEIESYFDGEARIEVRATNEDVKRYLEANLPRTEGIVRRDIDLQKEVAEKIVESVDGMFLLAQLRLSALTNMISIKEVRQVLERQSESSETSVYDIAYEDAMSRIRGQLGSSSKHAMRLLSWIASVTRQLTPTELQYALAVEVGESKFDGSNIPDLECMVSLCGGLVTIDEESDTIRLVHHTTQEYFERTWTNWFPNAQTDIANICYTYLSYTYLLPKPEPQRWGDDPSGQPLYFESPESEVFQFTLRYPLYDYVARNWAFHFRKANLEGKGSVLDFIHRPEVAATCSYDLAVSGHRRLLRDRPYWASHEKTQQLHVAAYFGLLTAAKSLLCMEEVDFDETTTDGHTPLMLAAENGHHEIVKLLVDEGACLEIQDMDKCTALWWAAARGHERVVEVLLEADADMDMGSSYKEKIISMAVEGGHESVVAMISETMEKKQTPQRHSQRGYGLLRAVQRGSNTTVESLPKDGLDLDFHGTQYHSALSAAVLRNEEAMVKLLLEKVQYINWVNFDIYSTVLFSAVAMGYDSIVRCLLDNGANPSLRDNLGQSAVFLASQAGHEEILVMLLERGADPTIRNAFMETPLIACLKLKAANNRIAKILVDKIRNLKACDGFEFDKALTEAVRNGNEEMVVYLVGNFANFQENGYTGSTPLLVAAFEGHDSIFKYLLSKGATIDFTPNGEGILEPDVQGTVNRIFNLASDLKGPTRDQRVREALLTLFPQSDLGLGFTTRQLYGNLLKFDFRGTDIRWHISTAAGAGDKRLVLKLLDEGVDINNTDIDGGTPLFYAILGAHDEMVDTLISGGAQLKFPNQFDQSLLSRTIAKTNYKMSIISTILENTCDIEAEDDTGCTALWWAAYKGDESLVVLLLDHRANHKAASPFGISVLGAASENGHEPVVSLLLDRCGDWKIEDVQWPLELAAEAGHDNLVEVLVKHCNANILSVDLVKVLEIASENGCESVVKLLLESGVQLEGRRTYDCTALSIAVMAGQEAIVTLLLDWGADIEAQEDNYGQTALSLAVSSGKPSVTKILVSRGASMQVKDKKGRTPLWLAVECFLRASPSESSRLREYSLIVEFLVESGSDQVADRIYDEIPWGTLEMMVRRDFDTIITLLVKNGTDSSQLLIPAAAHGRWRLVRLAVEKGADLTVRDSWERTPLLLAVKSGSLETVDVLLKNGASVDAKGADGRTPLSLAVEEGYTRIAILLLKAGADVESRDNSNRTPLLHAVCRGRSALTRLLLSKGADCEVKAGISLGQSSHTQTLYQVGEAGNGWSDSDSTLHHDFKPGPDLISDLNSMAEFRFTPDPEYALASSAYLDSDSQYVDKTPLWIASSRGDFGVTKALLDHGAYI